MVDLFSAFARQLADQFGYAYNMEEEEAGIAFLRYCQKMEKE